MPLSVAATLDEGYFDVQACNDTNRVDLFVFGRDDQVMLVSRMDNLGKGASGAAVQNDSRASVPKAAWAIASEE